MAAKKTVTVSPTTKNEIVELSKVYAVNGAFYTTRAEAELSLLKGDMYESYLARSGYGDVEKKRMQAAAARANYQGMYTYIDDVIKLLADRGVTFEKPPSEDADAVEEEAAASE